MAVTGMSAYHRFQSNTRTYLADQIVDRVICPQLPGRQFGRIQMTLMLIGLLTLPVTWISNPSVAKAVFNAASDRETS